MKSKKIMLYCVFVLFVINLLGITYKIYHNYDILYLFFDSWTDPKYKISPKIILHCTKDYERSFLIERTNKNFILPGIVLALQYEEPDNQNLLVLYKMETYIPNITIYNPTNLLECELQVVRINLNSMKITPITNNLNIVTQQLESVKDFIKHQL